MGWERTETTRVVYGIELSIDRIVRAPVKAVEETEQHGGIKRIYKGKIETEPLTYKEITFTGVDWDAIVAARPRCACRSLAELAAEALVAAHTREDIDGLGIPESLVERWVAPIFAGRPPRVVEQEPAAAPEPTRSRVSFDWQENCMNVDALSRAVARILAPFAGGPHAKILPIPYPALKEPEPQMMDRLRSWTKKMKDRVGDWIDDKRKRKRDDDAGETTRWKVDPDIFNPWDEPLAAWRTAAREANPCACLISLYACEDAGHGRKLFCIIPELTESWTSKQDWPAPDKIVNEVSVLPDEDDIDGIRRYGLNRVAQELFGGLVDDAAALRPSFFLCRQSDRS